MALIPKKQPKQGKAAPETKVKESAKVFENPENDGDSDEATETETAPVTESVTRTVAVAETRTMAVAAPSLRAITPFEDMREVYKVDYDTLPAIQVNQGNYLEKSTGQALGDSIGMELLSFQANFVISPGGDQEDEETTKLVRYSDDGKFIKGTGQPVHEYIQELKDADYDEAKMSERLVLVGELFDPGKLKSFQDKMVLIDLAPSSKKQFDQYQIQASRDIHKGRTTPQQATMLRMSCKVEVSTKGRKLQWTVALFEREPS